MCVEANLVFDVVLAGDLILFDNFFSSSNIIFDILTDDSENLFEIGFVISSSFVATSITGSSIFCDAFETSVTTGFTIPTELSNIKCDISFTSCKPSEQQYLLFRDCEHERKQEREIPLSSSDNCLGNLSKLRLIGDDIGRSISSGVGMLL